MRHAWGVHDAGTPSRRPLGVPGTRGARWSLVTPLLLIGGALVPMGIATATGEGGSEWPLAYHVVAFTCLIGGGLAAVAGGILAVRGVVRGERSLLLAIPVLAAALAIAFALGEVLGPH